MRGNATTSWRIDERWQRNKRRHKAEATQQETTQQPARENKRQMRDSRQRLRIKRQQRNENGMARGDATTSQGKQESGGTASVMELQPQQL